MARQPRADTSSCCSRFWHLLPVLAVMATLPTTLAYTCQSGVLQMKPFPQDRDAAAECFSSSLDSQSIKAVCLLALRVRVQQGVVKMVPIVQGAYYYRDSAQSTNVPIRFDCKDANASGLFRPGSTTSASVMLYDDFGGPFSNLTRTGPKQVSLSLGHTYAYRPPLPRCIFNYTVTQGCVFGIKAPAKPPPCPPGLVKKTGRFGTPYCAPCPVGTYSRKPGTACKPCPVGTYAAVQGAAKCTKCDPGSVAPKRGAAFCDYCNPDDNQWTDGNTCRACPKGSYVSPVDSSQCVRCYAGKKCCTVGWRKGCPKCTNDAPPRTYTSLFALEASAPASCLTTLHALVAPKISITVNGSCSIRVSNLDNNQEFPTEQPIGTTSCPWEATVPVQGARFSIADLAKFQYYFAPGYCSLLAGNFTAAASPYLTAYIPDTKCTLRYRALTAPAAALLGASPKAAPAASCSPGQYRDNSTDTPPGPCLPCPPGTYSQTPTLSTTCTPCPAGTYNARYGSTKCTKCPAGAVAPGQGATACSPCAVGGSPDIASPNRKTCVLCPKDSAVVYRRGACLGNAYGTPCCASGTCKGQAPCKGPRAPRTPKADPQTYTAVLQVASKSLPLPACRNMSLLSCLPVNGKVLLSASSFPCPACLELQMYRSTKCGSYRGSGGYTTTSGAYLRLLQASTDPRFKNGFFGTDTAYGLVSDPAMGTVTMYLAANVDDADVSAVPAKAPAACSVTLKLLNGYAFDLQPPAGAACHPDDEVSTYQGRKFCRACRAGEFRSGKTGRCQPCPEGYYSDKEGASTCKPCPAGYLCSQISQSTETPLPCDGGYYNSKSKQRECAVCPANTLGSPYGTPATSCTACPKGTIAPAMATACGIPWDKSFPA